jgi:hypothetical protein
MPIIDATVVARDGESLSPGTAKRLADAIGDCLGASPGRVWLRLELLAQGQYAENGVEEDPAPVFIRVLHADIRATERQEQEAYLLARAVGACLARPPEWVHIEYAPAGRVPWPSAVRCSSSGVATVAGVRPNPSLNRTRYDKRRKAGPRRMVHHRAPGLRHSPPRAG